MNADFETFAIQAAQTGSEQAWRQLFEQHFDAVYRFCVALAGGRHNIAEELSQQAFVIAARQDTSLRSQTSNFSSMAVRNCKEQPYSNAGQRAAAKAA